MRYLLPLLLAGCVAVPTATIDLSQKPPADWPTLEVKLQQSPQQQFDVICGKSPLPFVVHRISCAQVDFSQGKCWILVRAGETLEPYWEEHERQHCAGYDHHGESTLRDSWAKYKASRS